MASEYFIKRGDEVIGPFSPSALRQMALSGELSPDDLIGRGGGNVWSRAGTVRNLFPDSVPAIVPRTPPRTAGPVAAPETDVAAPTVDASRSTEQPTAPSTGPRPEPSTAGTPAGGRAPSKFVQLIYLPVSGELHALDEDGSIWRREESMVLADRSEASIWLLQPADRCMRDADGSVLRMDGKGQARPTVTLTRARSVPVIATPELSTLVEPPQLQAAPTAPPAEAPPPSHPTPPAAVAQQGRDSTPLPGGSGRGYVQSHLLRGEYVVHAAKLHWIIFLSLRSFLSIGILPFLQTRSSEFAVTNKRVIVKVGLISRRTLEMNLTKIETVNVNQSLFGRLFGYGTIVVIGTGGTRESFDRIANPMAFRKSFQESSA